MNKFYLLLTCLSTFAAFAQPANDDCQGAIPVQVNPDYGCASVTPGTLAGATLSNVPDTGAGTPDDDVWFTFTATHTTHRISMLNRVGNTTDLVHQVMSGNCNGELVSVNISDPETSNVSGLVVGQQYYLRVFSYYANSAATTTFNVCIGTPPAPPANDECAGAIAVIPNNSLQCVNFTSGTLAGATASAVTDNGAGTPDDDVWFVFTATSTTHQISLINRVGSTTDLVHEVMGGICTQLGSINISDPESSIVSGLNIGEQYYVRVFSYYANTAADTTFDLCIGTPPTLTNDDCFTAVSLTVNQDLNCGVVTSGTLNGSTPSNVPDNGAGTPDDDVWYSFVATNAAHQISLLNVSGNVTDMVHELMSGVCEAPVSLNVSDNNTSTVSGLTIGETYYVRVFSYGANNAANTIFNVCVGTPPPPPANDECANAISITPAATLEQSLVDGTISSATGSQGVPAPGCAGYTGGDVWYTVAIPASGNLTIETAPSLAGVTGFDSGLAVYAGACGNLTLVSCDDDGADTGNYSRITLTGRTPGEVVYVRVWEYLNDEAEPFSIGAYDSSLSAPSFDASGLRAYPNPVRDILNISYTMTIDSVEIFNLLGQRVSVKAVNQNALELNVSDLPSGTYLVKVNAQGGSETLKVLKP